MAQTLQAFPLTCPAVGRCGEREKGEAVYSFVIASGQPEVSSLPLRPPSPLNNQPDCLGNELCLSPQTVLLAAAAAASLHHVAFKSPHADS